MSEAPPLRVVIVDDEPLARQRLEDLLAAERGVEIAASVGDGRSAVEAIRAQRPDLVFLDIQMPGMTGLDVVRAIGPAAMPTTIFVTAYDQYALKAFELAATDYLVKPFDDERFEQAFRRARRQVGMQEAERMTRRLLTLMDGEGEGGAEAAPRGREPAPAKYLERIAVELRGQVRIVPVEQIDYITASGPYAELHTPSAVHLIRERMTTLEERLDPALFLRVHRSVLVRLDRIEALLRGGGGDYEVRLRSGVRLPVSRSRYDALAERLGMAR